MSKLCTSARPLPTGLKRLSAWPPAGSSNIPDRRRAEKLIGGRRASMIRCLRSTAERWVRSIKKSSVWEWYGRREPYFGVLSEDRHLVDTVRREIDPSFAPSRALDFGSGVGRLSIPLARRCKTVTGVDVWTGMREEANGNAIAFGLDDAVFVPSLKAAAFDKPYGLLVSLIVFQNIHPSQGEILLAKAVELLSSGGVGVVELPLPQPLLLRLACRFTTMLHGHEQLLSKLFRRPPPMGMCDCDIDRCRAILVANNCTPVFSQTRMQGRFAASLLFFRKR